MNSTRDVLKFIPIMNLRKKHELTSEMIKKISCFSKQSNIVQVEKVLENRFKAELSYQAVCTELCKVFPCFFRF